MIQSRQRRLFDRLFPTIERLEDRRQLAVAHAADFSVDPDSIWREVESSVAASISKSPTLRAQQYTLFTMDSRLLEKQLRDAPIENEFELGTSQLLISVPTPDGELARFSIFSAPVMVPELAAKFPEILTFAGEGISDPTATVRLDLTPAGFHAQVLSPNGAYYVDPYYHLESDLYASYFASGSFGAEEFEELELEVLENQSETLARTSLDVGFGASGSSAKDGPGTPLNRSGTQLRTYRAAVAATAEYTAFHGGTVALGQAAIATAINRVTGIYENELSIRLQLVANNDLLVYTDSVTDPYTNNNGSTMLGQNQTNVNNIIGIANYDIGHVFSTGGGGVASLGSVGVAGAKARGVTGSPSPVGDAFWVDYVAHEMGHQFGGNHTFNGGSGSCGGGNRNAGTAYEPGSGSTIQGYAGICQSDNLQSNSDPYFHSISFDEIISYVDNVIPTVGVRTATGNSVPTVDAGSDFTIPANTPFVLTATGNDANSSNVLTYNWEQRNLGPQQAVGAADNGSSPLFRSWLPTPNPTRTFPRLSNLVNNTFAVGEKMPLTTRTLNFRTTVRDNAVGGGGVNTDDMIVNVVNTGSAFAVTSPNTSVTWSGLSVQTVTWNVAGTTGNGINAANVDISLSTDGGLTYPIVLTAGTPNDGSQDIAVPNVSTLNARVRVQGSSNIFFDISNTNFSITALPTGIDFGDAPDVPYGTLLASNGPRHTVGGPVLGTMLDVESDGQPSANATGDGNDEDGVRFINPLVVGTTVDVEVRSSSGGGQLNYFFDFDGVGGFGNISNEIFSVTLTGGTQLVSVIIPTSAVLATFARFRISTEGGLGPLGAAATGEVEDYAVSFFAAPPPMDFGDAPDPAYATLLANNGARHIVSPSGPRLGAAIDAELNGQPNATSTGDGADEDGVLFRVPLVPGTNVPISVTTTVGVLDYFFDFDGNGVFGNQANEVFSTTLVAGTQILQVTVPANAVLGTSRARFRISTAGSLSATGSAQDGEVEDYQIMIVVPPNADYENFDGQSAPILPVGWSATTTSTNNWTTTSTGSDSAPNHAFVNSLTTVSDSRLTSPTIALSALNRRLRFRNSYNTEPNFDGGALEISVASGVFQDIVAAGGVFVQGGYNGTLSTVDGSPMAGRRAWTGNSNGFIDTIVDLPPAALGLNAQLRWRFATDVGISTGPWRIDSVRLLAIDFSFDFGDAPDPSFPTLAASNGAAHANGGVLTLGAALDAEANGQPSADGTGDGADDDGVSFPPVLSGGVSNPITVNASAGAILNAWIDFNNNGNWNDPGEQVFKDRAVNAGANSLSILVPNVASPIAPFARFRLSTQSGLAADGTAPDGEVEDYRLTIAIGDTTPPVVNSVKVSSSAWATAFKSYVDPIIPDPAVAGGSTPDSRGVAVATDTQANQLRPHPWTSINQLLLRFSEDVRGTGAGGSFLAPSPTQSGDVQILGVNVPNYGSQGGSSLISSVAFNAVTDTLVIDFSTPIAADKLLVVVPAGRISDLAGNSLPSFNFRLNILPGDINGNEVVANNDTTLARLHLDRTTESGADFDPRRDLNGSGVIANNDSTLARLRLDTFLPAGEPGTGARGEGESDQSQLALFHSVWDEAFLQVLKSLPDAVPADCRA